MKTTISSKTTVKKAVYIYVNSFEFLILNKKPNLDMRYKSSHDFMNLFYLVTKNFDKNAALLKFKSRRNTNFNFENVLQNKIYLDYKKNYNDIKFINDISIIFFGRNHHAKSGFDQKVLAILKRNFIESKKAA